MKMNTNVDKVIATLKFLGIKPNNISENYEDRFLVQKITYLAQALSLPTNYNFTIHLQGPFSRELQSEYYDFHHQPRIESLQTTYSLTSSEKQVLEKIKGVCLKGIGCAKDIPTGSRQFNILESTATAVCLIKDNGKLSDLFPRIKELKPYLKDFEIIIGINNAKELLFKPEDLTKELKAEIAEWDSIED